MALLITCEHGGNAVPARYASAFRTSRAQQALGSHRGYDIGAADAARAMGRELGSRALIATVSRLLVDQNRSPGHRRLWSEFSEDLDRQAKASIMSRIYRPHRTRIMRAVQAAIDTDGRCVHIAVHSFTRRLGGVTRSADAGLLYDPSRPAEAALARSWQQRLATTAGYRVRRNYPYRGTSDGLTTALRRLFPDPAYVGIELELNQAVLAGDAAHRRRIGRFAARTLRDALVESADGDRATGHSRPPARLPTTFR